MPPPPPPPPPADSDESKSSSGSGSGSGSASGSDSDSSDSDSGSDRRRRSKKAADKPAAAAKARGGGAGRKKKGGSSSSGSGSDSSSSGSDSDSGSSSASPPPKKGRDRRPAPAKPAAKAPPPPAAAAAKASSGSKPAGKAKAGGGAAAVNLIDLGEPEGGAVTLLDLPAAPGAAGGAKPLSIAVGVLPASPALSALPSPAAAAAGGGKPTTPVGRRAAAGPAVDAKKLGVHSLLHFANGGGLSIDCCFTREASIYSSDMNTVKLVVTNTLSAPLTRVRVGDTRLESGMRLQPFAEIAALQPGASTSVNLYVDFGGKTRAANFDICTERGTYPVSVAVGAGELVTPVALSPDEFDALAAGLRGMHEHRVALPPGAAGAAADAAPPLAERVLVLCNLAPVAGGGDGVHRFAGRTLGGGEEGAMVLLAVDAAQGQVRGNSESTLLCRQLVKDVVNALR